MKTWGMEFSIYIYRGMKRGFIPFQLSLEMKEGLLKEEEEQ